MIFASLLLILVAIVLAVLGVIQGSDPLLVGSIVASLLTAVFLAVSARQAAAMRLAAGQDGFAVRLAPPRRGGDGTTSGTVYGRNAAAEDEPAASSPPDEEARAQERPVASGPVTIPSQDGPEDRDGERLDALTAPLDLGLGPEPESPTQVELDLRPDDSGAFDAADLLGPDEDPLDEPPVQLVPEAEAAMVAGLDTEVVVVDGRPRYHLPTCVHLQGREVDVLPVREAVELGFSPCGLCEPDTALLAQARRG